METATAGIPARTVVTGHATNATITPASGGVTLRAGSTLSNAVQVVMGSEQGFCNPIENQQFNRQLVGLANVAVEFGVSPASGITLLTTNTAVQPGIGGRYVAMTDGTGTASVGLAANAVGNYTITAIVRQVVPAGDRPGAILNQFTVGVTVTP